MGQFKFPTAKKQKSEQLSLISESKKKKMEVYE